MNWRDGILVSLGVLIAVSLVSHALLWHHAWELERMILLGRIAGPGRTVDQVHAWLGTPSYSMELPEGQSDADRIIVYRSGSSDLVDHEDLWLLIKDGRVLSASYPDYPTEREALNIR